VCQFAAVDEHGVALVFPIVQDLVGQANTYTLLVGPKAVGSLGCESYGAHALITPVLDAGTRMDLLPVNRKHTPKTCFFAHGQLVLDSSTIQPIPLNNKSAGINIIPAHIRPKVKLTHVLYLVVVPRPLRNLPVLYNELGLRPVVHRGNRIGKARDGDTHRP